MKVPNRVYARRHLRVDSRHFYAWKSSGTLYPASLALLWRDTVNAQPLRYITFNEKYLVVKNV